MVYRNLIILFGDQLSDAISSLNDFDKQQDRILMMEVADEATYVRHHKQKLVFVFSAMRHFAQYLQEKGMQLDYITLMSKRSRGSFLKTVRAYLSEKPAQKIIVTEPSEYRVLHDVRSNWRFGIDVEIREDDRFFCTQQEFKAYAKQHPTLRMEYFYRYMRKKTGILMLEGQPVGGKWNYDQQNREPYDEKINIPNPIRFGIDDITQTVIDMVSEQFSNHIGKLDTFNWAVTRRSAFMQLNHFINHSLPNFGRFQDAMATGEYRLFHSLISPYINIGLITPKEVIGKILQAYNQQENLPINAVEGVIRQILGWREYVRGIYWLKMPGYVQNNYLDASAPLPEFYWTADTKMACMRHVLQQTIDIGHSHHIQRLMITGNFALLSGIDIQSICDWYLAVYVDAYEWVELPNTLGMVCYADTGLMASKPYAASGNYINKMSDFCKGCHYDVNQKTGDKACPFNALYWRFLIKNKNKLAKNRRLQFPYAHINKMSQAQKEALVEQANTYIDSLAHK